MTLSVAFEDDGFLGDAHTDARLQTFGRRLSQANQTIDRLEDKLVSTRSELKQSRTARSTAERHLQSARVQAATQRAAAKADAPAVVINGTLRLACNKTEAAELLGVSVDFFDAHIADELACVRRGRLRLYALRELERWLADESERIGI
jgi:chromosome segregation ATPase